MNEGEGAKMEWQPIETAPKDGRDLWLYTENDYPAQFVCSFVDDPLAGAYWKYAEELVNNVLCEASPTHWMPLPDPPH